MLAAVSLAACGDSDGGSGTLATDPPGLTRITFVNKDGSAVDLLVEVADTPEERGVGLMNRESLAEEQGMLFVFEQEVQAAFWMKDTKIPLSIAFVEGEGEIVDMQDMEPLSEELHVPDKPYLYAVEVNQGWFSRNGIGVESAVRIARAAATETPALSP